MLDKISREKIRDGQYHLHHDQLQILFHQFLTINAELNISEPPLIFESSSIFLGVFSNFLLLFYQMGRPVHL